METSNKQEFFVDPSIIERTKDLFSFIEPFSGIAEAGRTYNFVGALLARHLTKNTPDLSNKGLRKTYRPEIKDGEIFAEWYSTFKSIECAKKNYLMISLGAHLGGPIVNAYKLLNCYKPLPTHFIAVEADENMCELLRDNLAENNIPASTVTINQLAINLSSLPRVFTSSETPTGSTRFYDNFKLLPERIMQSNASELILEPILKYAKTFIPVKIVNDGPPAKAELNIVSTTTIENIVKPHKIINYIEVDIQGEEYQSIPKIMELLNEKVVWMHIGTHNDSECHNVLKKMFTVHGWELHIDWQPNSTYKIGADQFNTCDGVLSLCNPRVLNKI